MGEIIYSEAITFYGIPIFYIVITVLIILFILYLLSLSQNLEFHLYIFNSELLIEFTLTKMIPKLF
jgi:hypothetical protein